MFRVNLFLIAPTYTRLRAPPVYVDSSGDIYMVTRSVLQGLEDACEPHMSKTVLFTVRRIVIVEVICTSLVAGADNEEAP